MKRWVRIGLVSLGGLLLGVALLVLHPPAVLWKGALRAGLGKVNASAPFEIRVERIAGNLSGAIVLQDVSVHLKSPETELARAESVALDIRWKALLDKRVELERIRIDHPVFTVVLKPDRTWNFSAFAKASADKPTFQFVGAPLEVVDGQVLFINQTMHPEQRITLDDVEFEAHVSSQALTLKQASLRLGQGKLAASGRTIFSPILKADIEATTRQFPFEKLIGAFAPMNPALQVASTADWQIKAVGAELQVVSVGKLADATLHLSAHRSEKGALAFSLDAPGLTLSKIWRRPSMDVWKPLEAHIAGSLPSPSSKALTLHGTLRTGFESEDKTAIVTARFDLTHGRGPLTVDILKDQHQARFKGRVDLPGETLQMTNELDPQILSMWAPGVTAPEGGKLHLELEAVRKSGKSVLTGRLTGQIPRLKAADIGLDLEALQIDVEATGTELAVHTLTAKTDHGVLTVKGRSRLPALDFELIGSEVELKKKKEIEAKGHFQIHLAGNLDAPDVTGNVIIEKGTYYAPDTKKKKKARQAAASPMEPADVWVHTRMDIQVPWPGRVWYRDEMTGIETAGDLRIQKDRGETQVYLTGVIRVVRGTADYYGRRFDIDAGELRFLGAAQPQPELNVRATYRADPTIIHLLVTGPANNVSLKLESNPPMSDQDILSVIVFGRPLNEIQNKGSMDENSREKLSEIAGSVLGSYVAKGLHHTGIGVLEFDTVDIKPPKEDQGAQVTVGRYLGSRFFLSYGQEMKENQRTFTAEYFLNRRLTLAGQSGTEESNRLDLLLRIPLNGVASESYYHAGSDALPPNPNQLFDQDRRKMR